jgi:hypothetical protein
MKNRVERTKYSKAKIFLPYYINQSRLIDIYSIINGGYSEYSEISSALNTGKNTELSAEGTFGGGFKVFNFGTNVSAKKSLLNEKRNSSTEKKVQTVTSVLSIVKENLNCNEYLKEIDNVNPGQFIDIPVTLSINSIKLFLEEIQGISSLLNDLNKAKIDVGNSYAEIKKISEMKAIKIVFEGEEILYETEKYAIIGNIYDNNLYEANRSDIIGTELNCLAQVRRIYPNGTQLFKNSIFTKLKDASSKKALIEALNGITKADFFDFESVVVPEIINKPVYQVEIIALYQ